MIISHTSDTIPEYTYEQLRSAPEGYYTRIEGQSHLPLEYRVKAGHIYFKFTSSPREWGLSGPGSQGASIFQYEGPL